MELEKSEKVLLAVGLFMCAFIVGYNAFFVPEAGPTTIVQNNKIDDKSIDASSNDVDTDNNIDIKNSDSNSKIENENTDKEIISQNSNANIKEVTTNKENKSDYVNSLININKATESEISENLKGIGTVIAKRIVEYREKNGGFSNIEEIKNVKGIGEKVFARIKDNITVK